MYNLNQIWYSAQTIQSILASSRHDVGTTNTKSKFRFPIQKLHHCIRESVLSTMQKKFHEYT